MQTSINFEIIQTFVLFEMWTFQISRICWMLSWRIVRAVRFRGDKEVRQLDRGR